MRIVTRKVPGVNERLAREISRFMETVRTIRLAKVPGVAETLDWAQALTSLHADHLDEELVTETLGCVVKDVDDVKRLKRELAPAVSAASSPRRAERLWRRPAISRAPRWPSAPCCARPGCP